MTTSRSWWRTLLDEERRAGFPHLAGSEGTLQFALSDALLNELIAARLPATWRISELTLHAFEHNQVSILVRPRTAWLPPIRVRVTIDEQPATLALPLLRARFTSSIGRFADVALEYVRMPDWLHVSGHDVTIDLAALAAHYDMADLLPLLRKLTIGSEPSRLILAAEFVPPVA